MTERQIRHCEQLRRSIKSESLKGLAGSYKSEAHFGLHLRYLSVGHLRLNTAVIMHVGVIQMLFAIREETKRLHFIMHGIGHNFLDGILDL